MNTETVIFMFGVFWLGMVFGWLCKGSWSGFRNIFGRLFWLFVLLSITAPFLDFMIVADSVYMTVPFILGVLVQVWRSVLRILK